MKNKSLFLFLLPTFFILFGLLSLNMFSASTVYASTPPTHTHHATKIVVHMHFVHLFKSKAVPNNTITDDCGTIEMYIIDTGSGTAEFTEYTSSSQGIIESLTYSLTWYNFSTEQGSHFGGTFLFPNNPWEHEDHKVTETGRILANMVVTDSVGFGNLCQGKATDNEDITD